MDLVSTNPFYLEDLLSDVEDISKLGEWTTGLQLSLPPRVLVTLDLMMLVENSRPSVPCRL